jgi:RimJ/RimL family protein N-acetyltransferase
MTVDRQPILTGELVLLRPLQAADFAGLYAVAADPLIWDQHPDKTRSQEAGFQTFFQQALESGGALVVLDRVDGQIIGTSRFHSYDEEQSEITIGWTFLARSHWGGRYNHEMKQLMLRHAFRFVNNIRFLVDFQNYRSQRAVEKIGGRRVGTQPGINDREVFVYRITAADFFSANEGGQQESGSDPALGGL